MRTVSPSVATSFVINECSLTLTKERIRHNSPDFLANEISQADSSIFWLNIERTVELRGMTRRGREASQTRFRAEVKADQISTIKRATDF